MDQVTEKLSKVKLEDAKSSSEQQAGKRIEYDRKAYKKRLLLLERAPEQSEFFFANLLSKEFI